MKKMLKKLIPTSLFRELEPTYHLLEAIFFATIYGFPARKMKVIGVTGTNGKTSTSFMIHRILVEAGVRTGLMTTVSYGVDDEIVDRQEHMTTVSAPELQKQLASFKKQGVEWVIIETTSHALAQHRVFGIPFSIAVLTNITHEHLDYHGTIENYAKAKVSLLKDVARRGGVSFVNADDELSVKYTQGVSGVKTYGINQGETKAIDIAQTTVGSTYSAYLGDQAVELACNIPGEFNIYNSLAASLTAEAVGVAPEQISRGLKKLKQIDGRMNVIDEGQDFSVIIDFAHTPDSFEKLLSSVRKNTKGKLVTVFGSAGRRDEAKRATQGEIAGRYADEVVLTEEDDRDIDGHEILEQIAEGARKSGKLRNSDLFLILDRVEAINFAVKRASGADDTVIFLGKGHEKTIERADGEHPWDEADEVRQAIANLERD